MIVRVQVAREGGRRRLRLRKPWAWTKTENTVLVVVGDTRTAIRYAASAGRGVADYGGMWYGFELTHLRDDDEPARPTGLVA